MAMVNENIVIRLAQDVDIPEVKQLLERYHAKKSCRRATGEWICHHRYDGAAIKRTKFSRKWCGDRR